MKLVLFIEDSVLHKFLGTAMGVENVAWLRGWKATQLELFPFLVTSPVTSNSIQNRWFRLVPNAPKMIDVVVYEKQKKIQVDILVQLLAAAFKQKAVRRLKRPSAIIYDTI